MKSCSSFLIAFFFIVSCNNTESDAENIAGSIKEQAVKTSPGMETTSDNGYMMKATIDGRDWIAAAMLRDEDAGSNYQQVNGEGDDITISFQLWKPGIKDGETRDFRENYTASLWHGDDILSARMGEVRITRVDEQWIEGNFHFTASGRMTEKKVNVTNGLFRVSAR